MELRVAIRVADERDHKHLSSTIRLANRRNSHVRLVECPFTEADVVIVRRGESGSALFLQACEAAGHPVPIIYSSNCNEPGWVLRWPARTTDLINLTEAMLIRVLASQETDSDTTNRVSRQHTH